MQPPRRGLALLVVIGILGVLVVLLTAFVTMAQLERRASQQRIHATQALLLARSGMEDAMAKMGAGQDPRDGTDTGTLRTGAGSYALRISDESGKINVNGGILGGPLTAGWNSQLQRILNLLGAQPELAIGNLGNSILATRPPEGHSSIARLQSLLGTTKDLSPYLTVNSWTDRKVLRPNAANASVSSANDMKKRRTALALEEGGRPPVNLNSAPRPVLVALLQDLTASYNPYCMIGYRFYAITPALASVLADEILRRRESRPFSSWEDFGSFCDGLVPTVISGLSLARVGGGAGNLCGADLLKANFDPNSMLNKDVPDPLMWRWIDKSDLTVWSTEGCLSPTGMFRVSSLGRVTGLQGRLLASAELWADLEAFRLLRHTTQKDFVAGRTLTPAMGNPRYLSLASPMTDPGLQGYGAGASAAWWGGAARSEGLAVMTYPCPVTALPGNAAAFDGYVGLATAETGHAAPSEGALTFLHHFDDGLDADRGDFPALKPSGGAPAYDFWLQKDLTVSTWPPPSVQPNVLCPDGLHEQYYRSPCFQAQGHFPDGDASSSHGALGFWIKSVKDGADSYHDVFFSCINIVGAETMTLILGSSSQQFGFLMENSGRPDSADTSHERQCAVSTVPAPAFSRRPGARWEWITACWDTDQADTDRDVRLILKGLQPVCSSNQESNYPTEYAVTDSEGFTPNASNYMIFGIHPRSRQGQNFPRSILDEFAICDFGDDDSEQNPPFRKAGLWAMDRYKAGRYYKEGDGTFTSTPLQPQPGESPRLLRARWTEYLPRDPRMELLTTSAPTVPVSGEPRLLDPRLRDARLELELLDASGTALIQPLRQGERIGLPLDAFRYRVNFKVKPVDPATGLVDIANQPVLETPFFDDITFEWQAATGPRILGWGEP